MKTNDDKVYVQKEGAKKAETAGFAKFTLQAPGQIYLSAEELNTIFGVQKEDAGVKLTFNKDVLGTTLTNPFNANKFLAEESGDTKYLYISDLKKEAYLRVDTAYTNESGTKFLAYNWTKKGKTGEAIDAVRGSKFKININLLSFILRLMIAYISMCIQSLGMRQKLIGRHL